MTPSELRGRLADAPILPILTVRAVETTMQQIDRLVACGIAAIEVVFRTSEAAGALAAAKARHPATLFGAGTIMTAEAVTEAVAARADFLVSPGLTPWLVDLVRPTGLPHIPGIQTASEVMTAVHYGYSLMKFYPAQASNGAMVLADYANIFPDIGFVPTGKIDAASLPSYLALANVVAAGGSWMLSPASLADGSELRAQIASGRAAKAASG
ncbi:bifunctional 4-hydroxy-2-oxoglutarate aldolase/2-dehydro-3-deoxy-phosphogluconate aldolase [Mesorhizobium sp. BR1-1-16]|uniref:bifunctional 4-hydroxy-2-oxoglutarate aldolase/2-dehydro-3-deoxy-phosphogluconate aldolase n=1 Tax=Mesorhizobium sp. BR1-1-16 TaxID=2876653 RepID=UPI001CCB986D|nr:bifunctional 4-hydroxy-2-oxoglutarate aldolase/2-dehydro-3-deoxy-phosphogluconate aldolase [Mesorhizobium sp. BR1-1-16]MBZ9938410.1 bifunctional 4-hydroxy-2-oxoglutarate aldolase/2-dehydro-3-deoxy-phosphogluconate aldolase [Mesorhizobium sp. BR1-1-16]